MVGVRVRLGFLRCGKGERGRGRGRERERGGCCGSLNRRGCGYGCVPCLGRVWGRGWGGGGGGGVFFFFFGGEIGFDGWMAGWMAGMEP